MTFTLTNLTKYVKMMGNRVTAVHVFLSISDIWYFATTQVYDAIALSGDSPFIPNCLFEHGLHARIPCNYLLYVAPLNVLLTLTIVPSSIMESKPLQSNIFPLDVGHSQ